MSRSSWLTYGGLGTLALAGACALAFALLPRMPLRSAGPPPGAAPPAATISLVGDILLAARVGALARKAGVASLFAGVSPLFTADDLTIGNLECAVSTHGTAAGKKYAFRAAPALLPGLRAAGVDAVSLANNHALDYGRPALLDTLAGLEDAGIAAAGAGRTGDGARRAAVFATPGGTVALVAASRVLPSAGWQAGPSRPGIAGAYDPAGLCREIARVRAEVDVVLVYLHWGVEKATTPGAWQRALARRCIDAGADAVIGSHPHVLQGFEYIRGKPVAYSLGNFVFSSRTRETVVLQLEVAGGALRAARVIPCRIRDYRPAPLAAPAARRALLRALERRSFGVRLAEDGTLTPR